MQKVIVIGSPGAGKSTFARKLRDATGLPLHYLDMLWHRPDGTHTTQEAFERQCAAIMAGGRWIIDGNYQRTLSQRLQMCDTVFWLDMPPAVCLAGARARIGQKREDLPWIEQELDEEFQRWIEDFPHRQRPAMRALLEQYRGRREIVVFHTRMQADQYIQTAFG